ncbi:MAG TPA: Hsp20/alpha crystallin family protein [Gemmatimonadales bacterium]
MAISRYREPTSLFGLQRLNRILDEAFSGLPFAEQENVITSTWFAPTDVSEDESSLQITMELPGVDPNDVRLSLENNILTIRGEKKHETQESTERVHRSERTYGMFERTFVLPNSVDPDKIEARYENGVLFVTIPKAERAKPREIRVNTSVSSGSPQVQTRPQSQRGTSGQSRAGNGGSRDPEEEGSAGKTQR